MALMGLVYTIEAAHSAFGGPLHGHSFRIEIYLEGRLRNNAVAGLDFKFVREKINKVVMKLDRKNLNEIIEEPTVENIACYLIKNLRSWPIKSVKVWESSDRFAEVNLEEVIKLTKK